MPSNRKKTCVFALLLATAVFLSCESEKPLETGPAGLYLAMGSAHSDKPVCFRIGADSGGLSVVIEASDGDPDRWRLGNRPGGMTLSHNSEYWEDGKKASKWRKVFDLVPSHEVLGDWDLAVVHNLSSQSGEKLTSIPYTLPEHVPSFLHRMEDVRAMEYLRAVQKEETYPILSMNEEAARKRAQPFLKLAEAMKRDAPDDPFVELFHIDAVTRLCDPNRLEVEIAVWNTRYETSRLFQLPMRRIKRTLESMREDAKFRESRVPFTPSAGTPKHLLEIDKQIWEFTQLGKAVEHNFYYAPMSGLHWGNYLEVQVRFKVACVTALFLEMRGFREKALELLVPLYRFGQAMNQNNSSVHRQIGAAMRQIVCKELGTFALNACETPEELEHLWEKALEPLNETKKNVVLEEFFRLEWPSVWADKKAWEDDAHYGPIARRVRTNQRSADARFQLLRLAAAARHRFLKTGAFPRTATDFAPFLPAGPPIDPFSGGQLKYRTTPEGFVCYSVGPDGVDDRAAVAYESSDGPESKGDIVVAVPRQREFPFQKTGVRTANRDHLLKQFPNGLPPDIFTRGSTLQVTDTRPLHIFSVGPDTRENSFTRKDGKRRKRRLNDPPDVAYDPTNGATSRGDLWFAVPGLLRTR